MLCVCVCVCPGEGNVAFNATPNPFHLNKICLNQRWRLMDTKCAIHDLEVMSSNPIRAEPWMHSTSDVLEPKLKGLIVNVI